MTDDDIPAPGGNIATDAFQELWDQSLAAAVRDDLLTAQTALICQMEVLTSKSIHTVPIIFYNFIDEPFSDMSDVEERVKAKYGASKALQGNSEFNDSYFICIGDPSRLGILQTLEALGQYAEIPWIRATIWRRFPLTKLILRLQMEDAMVVGHLDAIGYRMCCIAYRRVVVLEDKRGIFDMMTGM